MAYAVYTIVKKTNGEKQNIMITNVEAHSACAAEHKILDSFYTGVDNATAYDMDNIKEMEYAARYFNGAHIYDYKAFIVKAKARELKIQDAIDNQLDEIEEIKAENNGLYKEIAELQMAIAALKDTIKGNNEIITDMQEELNDFCKSLGAKPIHSDDTIIGIA